MKTTFQFLVFALVLSSIGASCGKEKDTYVEVPFEFAIPVSILPGTDTINVGQNLTLTANFTDSLFDFVSQKKYSLPNFDFKTVAVIQKLVNPNLSITEQLGAVNKLTYNNVEGKFDNFSPRFADVKYLYTNNAYKLKVTLTPSEPGIYSIYFYHSTGTKGSTELPTYLAPSEPGTKRFPLMRVIRYTFNNGNTHFNIYKNNCKPADPNESTNWVESKSSYTFVVK